MTYNVYSGTLNPTQSINQSVLHGRMGPVGDLPWLGSVLGVPCTALTLLVGRVSDSAHRLHLLRRRVGRKFFVCVDLYSSPLWFRDNELRRGTFYVVTLICNFTAQINICLLKYSVLWRKPAGFVVPFCIPVWQTDRLRDMAYAAVCMCVAYTSCAKNSPPPAVESIWAMMIAWKIRGKIIRTVLVCCIVLLFLAFVAFSFFSLLSQQMKNVSNMTCFVLFC